MTISRRKKPKSMHKAAPGKRWVRYSPAARRELILSEAIIFFADHGFEAQTRDLAARIGVSQGLVYRYFRTKADLIDEVYKRIYISRWNAFWETILSDRGKSLEQRLKEFYKSHLSTFDDYAWIRVSVYSGLRGDNLANRYIDMIIKPAIYIISVELRHECGLPVLAPTDIPKLDLELTWNFHSSIIYFLMHRYVFQKQPSDENDAVVEQMVDQLLIGTIATLQQRYPSSMALRSLRQR